MGGKKAASKQTLEPKPLGHKQLQAGILVANLQVTNGDLLLL